MLYCYCVALLIFVLSYVLIVCTVPLPPGVNPIAVDKYIILKLTLKQLRHVSVQAHHHQGATASIDIDIFVNCNWVNTRWQWYSTHNQYIGQHK